LTGKTPFKDTTEFLTYENIVNHRVSFPEDIDADAKDLI